MNPTRTIATRRLLIAPLDDAEAWDSVVHASANATVCHLYGWRHVLEGTLGHRPVYYGAWDEAGHIRGILPLVRVNSRLFGVRYVSVPCLNSGGPAGTPDAVDALVSHSVELARAEGVPLELRTRAPVRPGTVTRKVTVVLELPTTPDALWSRLPSKVRSQVRRPQKAGMTIRFGLDQLDAFYDVWSRNMRDLGTPALPRAFFRDIARLFPEYLTVGVVYAGAMPVAAGAGFIFRDEFEITWASALRKYSREAPNMLLYWEFMSHAITRGARAFDFGRCTPGEGAHRFKLQWGGESRPLPWISAGSCGSDMSPGRAVRAASAAWQRLPLPLANVFGPFVAKRLPWW